MGIQGNDFEPNEDDVMNEKGGAATPPSEFSSEHISNLMEVTDKDIYNDENEDADEYRHENIMEGGDNQPIAPPPPPKPKKEDEEDDDQEEEEKSLSFEDDTDSDGFTDKDLEAFNKKMKSDYDMEGFRKKFGDQKSETDQQADEQKLYDEAQQSVQWYDQILSIRDDEKLMRKNLEVIEMNNGKDLNSDEVQYDIENKLSEYVDKGVLKLYADNLRREINTNRDKFVSTKESIENKRTTREAEKLQTRKQGIEKELMDIHQKGDFFGVKPQDDILKKIYKDAVSGDLIKELQNDEKALIELAMMRAYKSEIYKRSTGKTFADGVDSVLNEFSSKKDDVSIASAQRKGASIGRNSAKDFMEDILK